MLKKSLLLLFITLLSACGGGGGSGSGSGSQASPSPTVKITTSNAPQTASTSMSSDSVTTNVGGLTVLSAGSSTSNSIMLTDFTRQVLKLDQYGSLQTQIFDPNTICAVSGRAMLSGDANNGSIVFSSCDTGGFVLDGTISYAITGTSNNLTATVTYTGFTFSDTSTSTSATVNASLSLHLVTDNSGNTTLTTSIPSFSMAIGTDYVHIYNLTSTVVSDAAGNTTSDFDFTFESSLISGIVRVTTAASEGGQTILRNYMDPYPYSGSLVVIGDNSRARVTFNGSGQATGIVTVEVDADGDGVYESSVDHTWSTFVALSML